VEVLYHTLWETVHVFFESHSTGGNPDSSDDLGASGFLYPFLTATSVDAGDVVSQVAASICAKAAEDERLREEVARDQADAIAAAAEAVGRRLLAGATLLMFGNGGSATDANDWAVDCVSPAFGVAVRALSLSMEPASITAIANDVGQELVFLRQRIAHGGPGDVAISTSGGSANVTATTGPSGAERCTSGASAPAWSVLRISLEPCFPVGTLRRSSRAGGRGFSCRTCHSRFDSAPVFFFRRDISTPAGLSEAACACFRPRRQHACSTSLPRCWGSRAR
jgi:phosphoheptose isomerase